LALTLLAAIGCFVVISSTEELSEDIDAPGIGFSVDGVNYIYAPIPGAFVFAGSYDSEYAGTITIPGTVVDGANTFTVIGIGDGAFSGCTKFTSLILPDSITNIGSNAFNGCTVLESVTISDSVSSIGDGSFDGCSSLTSVICCAQNAPTLGDDNVFRGCSGSLKTYVPSGSVSDYQSKGYINVQD